MKIKVLDGSNYFRGLLLLIRKDREISELEKELMGRVGKALGFETEFCNNAINEILHNEHITDTPPEFSTTELAKKFIKDGLMIASSDGEIDPLEEEWLKATAEKNRLDPNWFRQEMNNHARGAELSTLLEADDLTVTHSWAK